MRKVITTLVLAGLFLGPSVVLLGLGVLMNPAARAEAVCLPGTSLTVGPVPDSLTATTRNGETVTLNRAQLTHAATIITIGGQTEGINDRGAVIALMAALTESHLRMLSNTSVYPESGDYPNDGDGSDHDSLGLFQMRPATGWGTVAELMDPTYQARAFYGGPEGPNHPSPRGLLDIPGWEQMDPGEAAQAVEVSAYPDRYQNYQPVAETILATLTRPAGGGGDAGVVPETSRVLFPLPEGTWTKTSDFGWRTHPITGDRSFHTGTDYAAADGTPLFAVADGRVTTAEFSGGYGGLIVIDHTVAGQRVATAYAHMWSHGIHVQAGDTVTAGQHIGDVGSSGNSTGPHLHLEVRPGGPDAEAVDAAAWLAEHGATEHEGGSTAGPGCAPGADAGPPAGFPGGDPDAMVDDPTSDGQITARTAHVLDQVRAAFPGSAWACYSPRPGTVSEHPLGRACDGTFGNAIGEPATGETLELGWAVTNWLQTHADTLGVEYLIWQDQIWSTARADEGWRPYTRGTDVVTRHLDHVHVTIREGA